MAKSALAERLLPEPLALLVEDNPSDAFLIGNLLAETGYETFVARTQQEAIAALDEQPFDVCLLDLTLPDAIGFSALIDLQEKAPAMPVLILTGVNDTGVARQAVGRGAQDYLLKDELELAMLARAMEYAKQRKHIEKELFQRANHDALTGLANRSLFESRLKMALARSERTRQGLAVLYLDLDRFKPVNDTCGHDAGDHLLKAVADRVTGVLRPYDTAARLGGDEFAVVLENISSSRDAAIIAQKILSALSTPVHYENKKLNASASIGVAFTDTACQPDTLLQNADAAMYQAKASGGNAYRFYASETHHKARSRLQSEEELRAALVDGQFRLYYQPYIVSRSNAVLGVEALLRWAHPERGMLCPGEFMALAEECRLMPEIAQWMFLKLRQDICLWDAPAVPPLEIAFNVGASQLDAPNFARWVAPLTSADIPGNHRFVAEIDSDALTKLSESRFLVLAALRELGVGLHLDHFGQGAVSLQTLHTYPFSLLKLNLASLDQVNMGGQSDAIINTAIELAHQLGMKAGAVGVETMRQMHMLERQRCDTIQGFLIGRPMTSQQLVQWLADGGNVFPSPGYLPAPAHYRSMSGM